MQCNRKTIAGLLLLPTLAAAANADTAVSLGLCPQ